MKASTWKLLEEEKLAKLAGRSSIKIDAGDSAPFLAFYNKLYGKKLFAFKNFS